MTAMASSDRLILPLPGNDAFARQLAAAGKWEQGTLETRRFPDGESYVRIAADVADKSVVLVQTLAQPDPGFLSLVFAADAARDLGAREVTLVAPYLAYMRQDRRFHPGEAITSRSFARLVSRASTAWSRSIPIYIATRRCRHSTPCQPTHCTPRRYWPTGSPPRWRALW